MAANASGDGIADSGFFQLPGGPVNGVTYYAAIRMIDQNSAINASAAWRGDVDPVGPGMNAPNYGYFRSNTGLQELLLQSAATQEMQNLNAIRFGQATSVLPTLTPPSVSLAPYDDAGNARTDFQFGSCGDALDSQLARRATAPGLNGATQPFAGFGLLETTELAHQFCLPSRFKCR